MNIKDRIVLWIAWHLPRSIAYWAYVRVATEGTTEPPLSSKNPTQQNVMEPMERWMGR